MEDFARQLAREGAVSNANDQPGQLRGADLAVGNVQSVAIELGRQLAHHPVGQGLGLGSGIGQGRQRGLEELGAGQAAGQRQCVGLRQAQLVLVAGALGAGQLGHVVAHGLDLRRIDDERRQVGLGEVAVVIRVFLGAHRAGLVGIRIVEPGFLHHAATVLDQLDLAAHLELDGPLQEAERVQVLDLGAGAEFLLAQRPDRNVGVHAEGSFLHVAVADAQPRHQAVQRPGIGHGLGGAAQLGFADDLQQRRAGPVQVDARHASKVLVQ